MPNVEKVLLFNDIKSSSKLWKKHKNNMFKSIEKLIKLMQKETKKYNGIIIKMMGDSFMISFNKIKDAINFSITINNFLNNKGLFIKGSRDKILLRTGICYGKVNEFSTHIQNCKFVDYFGNVVNTASRMESKVSEVNGFAIGILKENENDLKMISNLLETFENYNIEAINYTNTCDLSNRKRSSKLLHDINFYCDDIDKLHGVKNVKVLKVSPK